MPHYRANLADLHFNLFEMLGLDKVLDEYPDLDAETVESMLTELAKLAEGPLAESFTFVDRTPPTFDPATHTVQLPTELQDAVRAYREAGWPFVGIAEELGGTSVPSPLRWALNELVLGANPAVFMYATAQTSADIFFHQGTEEQLRWAHWLAERNWGSTMVLTEPDAGSDVGAGRTRARQQPDGSWHIEGLKRFITSADSGDLFENIVHFVLARPEGAGPGTKGLSLFLVPKFHVDPETGELGERNGVFVTNVEHKMGLKASATCELAFGAHGVPARGWLVGEVHDGIAQMFKTIEHARMFVGTKAIATLSTGYLNALEYAKTRVQGADLARGRQAGPVTIVGHPDVRRALLTQKAYVEGLRALYLFTAAHQDDSLAQLVSGADAATAARVNDLLLPVVKGFGSEVATRHLNEALQVLGGSGYLQDYPLEQYIRDSRIDALYEGTTAIQAQDFFFRKIVRDQGVALSHLAGAVRETVAEAAAVEDLATTAANLEVALADLEAMMSVLLTAVGAAQEDAEQLYVVGLSTTNLLLAAGDVLVGWMLVRQALVAQSVLRERRTGRQSAEFYRGKLAAAHLFGEQVLPSVTAARIATERTTLATMRLGEQSL